MGSIGTGAQVRYKVHAMKKSAEPEPTMGHIAPGKTRPDQKKKGSS